MNNLYFTIINQGYVIFAKNFLKRLNQIKSDEQFLIVCTDVSSFNEIKKIHNNVQLHDLPLSEQLEKWQTQKYKDIVFAKLDIKISVIEQFRNLYDNIIFIDTDIWINKNFKKNLEDILSNNNYDIIFQDGEDYLYDKQECCEFRHNKIIKNKYCNSYCTGFMIMNTKYSKKISNFLKYSECDKQSCNGNQQYINEKLYLDQSLNVAVLPKKIAPNMSQHNFYKQCEDYWFLHYTYMNAQQKIQYMKINGHWLIDQ